MFNPERKSFSVDPNELLNNPEHFIGRQAIVFFETEGGKSGLMGIITKIDPEERKIVISYKEKGQQINKEFKIDEVEIKIL